MDINDLFDGPFLETADASCWGSNEAFSPLEAHDLNKSQNTEVAGVNQDMVNSAMFDMPHWLPAAAEVYNISPNISDYVLVPTTILYSDIPNRNTVAFSFRELTAFNPEAGCLAYQTWKGKPTHVEHANQDITKAKGVIGEVAMRPVPGYQGNLWKVMTLLGFDRNRDPELCKGILSGERRTYSMGATCNDYACSICNASMARSNGRCEHIDITNTRNKLALREFGGKLAYRLATKNLTGIEVSSVAYPAWNMATYNGGH